MRIREEGQRVPSAISPESVIRHRRKVVSAMQENDRQWESAPEGLRRKRFPGRAMVWITVIFMTATVCLYIEEIRDQIHLLIKELTQSTTELNAARRELAQLKEHTGAIENSITQIHSTIQPIKTDIDAIQNNEKELQKTIVLKTGKLEEGINGKLSDIMTNIESNAEANNVALTELGALKREVKRDFTGLYRNVLLPSIQVNCKGSIGSGTIFSSRKEEKGKFSLYVVTAHHVIEKSISQSPEGKDLFEEIVVKAYDPEGKSMEELKATVIAYEKKKDIALLRIETERPLGYQATPITKEELGKLRVFTPVYAVGCPLGHEPLPTVGEIASLNKVVDGERYFMMNAPTIFGNSGGGVFLRDDFRMIGVSTMICTYDGLFTTPVPHLGVFIPMNVIYDWLDSCKLQHVYAPPPNSPAEMVKTVNKK